MWAFTQPINMFGTLVDNMQNFGASAERLYELHKTEPKIKNIAAVTDEDKTKGSENAALPGENMLEDDVPVETEKDTCLSQKKSETIRGEIEFRDVCFSYDSNKQVLKNVSFKIDPGMTVGILGPTGSGKSTIANLMCRYYDVSSGQILLDGKDIREYDLSVLRKNIGITMQEAFLFSDTVEGNIAFGNPDADFKAVEEAAELARVKEFIGDLSDGYDTIVGERGVGLSGGQKQRIALARLFLANPKVMILDDTTSAVDIETEEKIRKSIGIMSEGHTSFIISHRVSSFEKCDRILVIQDGRIVDSGTHSELSERPGYYRDVWMEQK
jgi:ATP-binding cassette subfamily B protein